MQYNGIMKKGSNPLRVFVTVYQVWLDSEFPLRCSGAAPLESFLAWRCSAACHGRREDLRQLDNVNDWEGRAVVNYNIRDYVIYDTKHDTK